MACNVEQQSSFISRCKIPNILYLCFPNIWNYFIVAKKAIPRSFRLNVTFRLILILIHIQILKAEGNVGCQYVKTLCIEGREVCFNDKIFGKCIPTTGVDMEDIDKTPLSADQIRALGDLLVQLQAGGLGWNHAYVQCRIQGALFSLRKMTPIPPHLCSNLAPSDDYVIFDDSHYFAPSIPNNNDLHQIFHSPFKKQLRTNSIGNKINLRNSPGLYTPRINIPEQYASEDDNEGMENHMLNQNGIYEENEPPIESKLDTYGNSLINKDISSLKPIERILGNRELLTEYPEIVSDSMERYLQLNKRPVSNLHILNKEQNENEYKLNKIFPYLPDSMPSSYSYNVDSPVSQSLLLKNVNTSAMNHRDIFYNHLIQNYFNPVKGMDTVDLNSYPSEESQRENEDLTEGGGPVSILNSVNNAKPDQLRKVKARDILANMLGFTRHERLDVKKPGPQIGGPTSLQALALKSKSSNNSKEVLPDHIKISNETNKKKKLVKGHSDEDHAAHSVDTEYAHVFVKNSIDNWSDGVRIMNELANILHMQGYFNYLTVQPHEVSFRVESNNPDRKTATDIARAINENRGVKINILRRLGVTILSAGVGDKIKENRNSGVSASRIELAERNADVTHILAYTFAGAGAAAIIVIFVTLIHIKRHDKKRDKLGGIQSGIAYSDTSNKDYQDLCRARMAGKGNSVESSTGGRITSLSKENEKPPSSRSSTSSWSEEPALTNMDISTGHMVLSYMEDHLRNKGRLQREWEGLCRYEAEPSAREAALQPQCAQLNRVGAPLPYDHSRVVLNHLANADGLDYINASTITDHDPRAPAYVAAQGPLPTTLAHFWQMVWEQGAVVIVSLCKLQENGEIACARYWPEEGAEVYHIYEVHLVSEHIWCDDYLVRSFYLKNLRTSETRTVTQFHFLSWPQNGVPAQAKPLLDFRRKVNKSYRGRSCPIVVHGSTGAGRTGAYILLDMVLGRMNKGAREIDIAATLEHLRDQRAGLVATRQQFEFVLMAVAEEVHTILKALPTNQTNEKRDYDNTTGIKIDSEETPTTSTKKGTLKEGTLSEKITIKNDNLNKNDKSLITVGRNIKRN